MLNICFGRHEDRIHDIEAAVDRAVFKCHFKDLNLVDAAEFDCIVPLHLSDYGALEWQIDYFGKKFLAPDPDLVELCNDKLALNRFLLEGEFADLVPPLLKHGSGQLPYVVKKRHDIWGQNSFIIRSSKDELAMKPIFRSPEYFSQTYIPGPEEFALHVLMVDAKVVYAKTVKHHMGQECYVRGEHGQTKHSSYLAESKHLPIFARVLAGLGYNGTCCIDYKIENGAPKLLEINPRYGGSLTGDINRYLDAYLCSLGIIDRPIFANRRISIAGRIHQLLESINMN